MDTELISFHKENTQSEARGWSLKISCCYLVSFWISQVPQNVISKCSLEMLFLSQPHCLSAAFQVAHEELFSSQSQGIAHVAQCKILVKHGNVLSGKQCQCRVAEGSAGIPQHMVNLEKAQWAGAGEVSPGESLIASGARQSHGDALRLMIMWGCSASATLGKHCFHTTVFK